MHSLCPAFGIAACGRLSKTHGPITGRLSHRLSFPLKVQIVSLLPRGLYVVIMKQQFVVVFFFWGGGVGSKSL